MMTSHPVDGLTEEKRQISSLPPFPPSRWGRGDVTERSGVQFLLLPPYRANIRDLKMFCSSQNIPEAISLKHYCAPLLWSRDLQFNEDGSWGGGLPPEHQNCIFVLLVKICLNLP
ncbi:hypothetical protein Y1Q_0021694 [Alligator mississippiensis]|uniref:Uncharacterized protein n=1 Tax=Alligator mississippiensis TaxID=8496 RepID=A0A151PAS2_ALLMI|nr:hypothetical protein Y1Q_0021694 [Alligator mississippiensis]